MKTIVKQTRRSFFRNVIGKTLPIIGIITLCNIPFQTKALSTNCTDGSCSGSCKGSCYGSCDGSCKDSCSGCTGSCSGTCNGQCVTICKY